MMFKIKKFFEYTDLPIINGWLGKHKHQLLRSYEIPNIGYVVIYGQVPIAAAFLRQMEGRHALFDGLVSNPEADGKIRNIAIEMLVKKIIKSARSHRIKHIMAYSVDESTLKRSLRHGFVQLPHIAITLDIKNSRLE